MRSIGILVLLGAAIAAAQNATPPATPAESASSGVEAALRDRVTKFYDTQMAGKYRQAEQYVAEDTKDYYYNLNKVPIIKYEITKVAFSDNFTKAIVTIRIEREFAQAMIPKMRLKTQDNTNWILENGLWCWRVDQTIMQTPFGNVRRATPDQVAAARGAMPPTGLPSVKQMMKSVGVDKSEVTLGARKTEEVVVTNSMPGVVALALDAPDTPGLEAKLDRDDLGPGGAARVLLSYNPAEGAAEQKDVTVNVIVRPTGQVIPITVKLKPAATAAK